MKEESEERISRSSLKKGLNQSSNKSKKSSSSSQESSLSESSEISKSSESNKSRNSVTSRKSSVSPNGLEKSKQKFWKYQP